MQEPFYRELKGLEWTFDTVASTYEKIRPGGAIGVDFRKESCVCFYGWFIYGADRSSEEKSLSGGGFDAACTCA